MYDDATQIGTVTITNYAQSSLGDVVFVELPQEGSKIAQGGTCAVCAASGQNRTLTPCADQIGAVESVKAASDIVSVPVTALLTQV